MWEIVSFAAPAQQVSGLTLHRPGWNQNAGSTSIFILSNLLFAFPSRMDAAYSPVGKTAGAEGMQPVPRLISPQGARDFFGFQVGQERDLVGSDQRDNLLT